MKRSDSGMHSHGVGSKVPVQSNSARNPAVISVADDIRMQLRLPVAAHVQEGGAFRGAKPLVGITGVVGRAEFR